MNTQSEHLKNLQEVRSTMERSSRFLSLSGFSGIFAGLFALLGVLVVYIYQQDFFYGKNITQGIFLDETMLSPNEVNGLIAFLFFDALFILIFALVMAVYFAMRNVRKNGLPVWDSIAKRMLVSLFIPLVTGGVFCFVLMHHHLIYLIASSTLVFYGLSLVSASKYTLSNVRYLGIAEVILGLIAMFYTTYGLIIWAVGFGVLHVIYGLSMFGKYEKNIIQAKE